MKLRALNVPALIVQWSGFLPSKQVTRVRIPVSACMHRDVPSSNLRLSLPPRSLVLWSSMPRSHDYECILSTASLSRWELGVHTNIPVQSTYMRKRILNLSVTGMLIKNATYVVFSIFMWQLISISTGVDYHGYLCKLPFNFRLITYVWFFKSHQMHREKPA